jgi:hypothetical protein
MISWPWRKPVSAMSATRPSMMTLVSTRMRQQQVELLGALEGDDHAEVDADEHDDHGDVAARRIRLGFRAAEKLERQHVEDLREDEPGGDADDETDEQGREAPDRDVAEVALDEDDSAPGGESGQHAEDGPALTADVGGDDATDDGRDEHEDDSQCDECHVGTTSE